MSFDLLTFDTGLFSASDFVVSSEPDLQFFSHDLSLIDDHHAIQQNPDENFHFSNQATTPHFHTQFSLSISPQTQSENFQSVPPNPNGFVDFSGFDMNNNSNDSTVFVENVAQVLQRSYSSNCFSEESGNSTQQPELNSVVKSPNHQNGLDNWAEKSFFCAQIRRVCSANDVQEMNTRPTIIQRSLMERNLIDENNFKVGKYSANERKERIHKYRAKRSQRNFNKTIKYACRKALADNRPRVRGRFARNDEIGDTTPNTAVMVVKDEDDIWVDGFNGEDYQGTIRAGGRFLNSYGPSLFQYDGR